MIFFGIAWYYSDNQSHVVARYGYVSINFLATIVPPFELNDLCVIHSRLKSAQAELKEKEKLCKDSEHTYTKDKADIDAIQKEIAKIEVRCLDQF